MHQSIAKPVLPEGFQWVAWHPAILESHAEVKSRSFEHEIDTQLFRSLTNIEGCRRLMREISLHHEFVPDSTWLIRHQLNRNDPVESCGTIQGVKRSRLVGAIQNVGTVPEHRGLGLGRALVLQSLLGFRRAQLSRVTLDVTAKNTLAVELYQSIGFRLIRTMYKEVLVTREPSMA
ncbi:MAG: GNAT family N-acetyltransferase [Planctomycetota bacterium]|nr:GNAT family N-acetyltransferase [Planctomycetota bacterium]